MTGISQRSGHILHRSTFRCYYRIVNKLMHESLTETLHLAGTVISVCHHCEVRVHTGIPAAVTLYAVSCVIIFDIIALAGRAYECTGTTCQTWFVKFFPYRRVKTVHVIFLSPSFQRKIRIRKLFYDGADCSFLFFYLCFIRIVKKFCNCFCKSFALFCKRFPVKLASLSSTVQHLQQDLHSQCQIPYRNSSLPVHDMQVQRWFHALFLLHRRYLPGHLRILQSRTSTARTSQAGVPEYSKRFVFECCRFDGNVVSLLLAGIKNFTLREKGIFWGLYGF